MRAPALALAPLLMAACAPMGRIHSPHGYERLRSAWTIDTEADGAPVRVLLLSTSAVACAPPSVPDPAAIDAYDSELLLAWTREGSQVLAFALFSADPADWSGSYPVDVAASPWGLTPQTPRAALAGFHAVWEAEIASEDGLYREYVPVVEEQAWPVGAPGTLTFEDQGDSSEGSFALDNLELSGGFHAEPCPAGEDHLLYVGFLNVLRSYLLAGDREEAP